MTKKEIAKTFLVSDRAIRQWEKSQPGIGQFLEIAALIKKENVSNYNILKLYEFYSYTSSFSILAKRAINFLKRKSFFENEEGLLEKTKRLFELNLTDEELKAFLVLIKKDFKISRPFDENQL